MKNNLIKSTLVVGTFFLSSVSFSQKTNETSAAVAYKNTFLTALGNQDLPVAKKALIDAKKYIDLAAENTETKGNQKTLWLKGAIYSSFLSVGLESNDSVFMKLAGEDALEKSISAFKAGYAIKGKFNSDIAESVEENYKLLNVLADAQYKDEKYKDAAETFSTQADFFDAINIFDSSAIFNSGLCFEKSGDYANAAKKYSILAKAGYKGASTYVLASSAYRKNGQIDDAKSIVAEGRVKYPQDKDILLEAVNTCLELKDPVGAESLLTEAIAKDPKNKLLHLTIGSIYIDLKQNEKAETSINNALVIDSEYEDALYQLGAHLVTWAGDLITEANNLKLNDPRQKILEKQAMDIYNRAIPPLEKFIAKNPNEKSVLTILSQLNRNIGNMEKSSEYKKRAEAIK